MAKRKDDQPKLPPEDSENPFIIAAAGVQLPKEEKGLDEILEKGMKTTNDMTVKKLFGAEVEEEDIEALGKAIDEALTHLDNIEEIKKLLSKLIK